MDESRVLALLQGRLEGTALANVEAHLAECEDCLLFVGAAANVLESCSEGTPSAGVRDAPASLHARYQLVDFIAEGGMGQVYKAIDRHTGQRVAIKTLKDGEGAQGAAALVRFAREGEALRRLNHPNIVQLLEVVEDSDQRHIVMEYVAGGSLRDLLRREGPLTVARALPLVLELTDGLSRAHHLGIIHRDIKPANVLLAEDGTARLTDFGLARMEDITFTQTGTVLGTVPYLSPEALCGHRLDARADMWSLGVTLFEMLSARLPFTGDTHAAIITAILHQPVPDLSAQCPATPPALVELLHGLLEKDPARRIASARQVGVAVEALLRTTGDGLPDLGEALVARDAALLPTTGDFAAIARAAARPGASHLSASGQTLEYPGSPPAPALARQRHVGRAALLALGACGAIGLALSLPRGTPNEQLRAQAEKLTPAQPPPLAVDDFEDDDIIPRDSRFARWQRYQYNTSGPVRAHAWTAPPGSGSNLSLHLAWMVQDEPNGKLDHAGAGVRSLASSSFVDLSPYSRMVFKQRYDGQAAFPRQWLAEFAKSFESRPRQGDRESPSLLPGVETCEHRRPSALVQLFCAEYNTFFEVEFPPSDEWQTTVVPFSSLHEPYWKPPTGTPLARCLSVTDSFGFIAQDNQLADGQCHSGSLWVDDISFR